MMSDIKVNKSQITFPHLKNIRKSNPWIFGRNFMQLYRRKKHGLTYQHYLFREKAIQKKQFFFKFFFETMTITYN